MGIISAKSFLSIKAGKMVYGHMFYQLFLVEELGVEKRIKDNCVWFVLPDFCSIQYKALPHMACYKMTSLVKTSLEADSIWNEYKFFSRFSILQLQLCADVTISNIIINMYVQSNKW